MGIVKTLISILIAFFVAAYLISGVYWFNKFKARNRRLSLLANEFGLYFESGLPTFWKFIFRSFRYNFQINRLEGTINRHNINIRDIFYPAAANLFNWGPPFVGLFYKDFNAGRRQTEIEIDGKAIHGGWKNFLLGIFLFIHQ